MFIFRVSLFTVLFPGTVTVVVPYFIVRHSQGGAGMPHPLWAWMGLLPLGAGITVLIRCIWEFAAVGRGTLAPMDPPRQLVVSGLYRYVRNPMYVGVLCVLGGEALLFSSVQMLTYAAIVFTTVHLFIVLYEEPALRRQFGESYESYTRRVHRWLPRRPDKSGG